MMDRLMRWAALLCAALVTMTFVGAATPTTLVAQDTTVVFVFTDRVMITILPPKLRVRPPRAQQLGFYAWRVDIKGGEGASIAFTADTAMRTTNLREIVRGSSLRRCADLNDFSALRCTIPLADSVMVRGEGIRIVLRDAALVAMMRKYRPATVWGSTFEPNGQFRVDRISVRYADGDGDGADGIW